MRRITSSFVLRLFSAGVLALVIIALPGIRALAQDGDIVARVVAAIERTLPPGWSMDESPANDFRARMAQLRGGDWPTGHWSCRKYSGPLGVMVEAVGPTPVEVEWETESGESGSTPVTHESIKIWVMPPDYRKDFGPLTRIIALLTFCETYQPETTQLYKGGKAIVYGLPSTLGRQDPIYDEIFQKAKRKLVFVDSPRNDHSKLSWESWARDLQVALRSELDESDLSVRDSDASWP